MSDQLFDHLMVAFAVCMWWVTLYRPIPTGILGSTGCIGLSVCALMAIDDSTFASVRAVESLFLGFCGSVGLVLLHVVLCLYKTHKGDAVYGQHRRGSDWPA